MKKLKKNMLEVDLFEKNFNYLLNKQHAKGVVKRAHDMEYIPLKLRFNYVLDEILNYNSNSQSNILKIEFWDKGLGRELPIYDFIKRSNIKGEVIFKKTPSANNKEGIFFIKNLDVESIFFKELMISHFNFELGKSPALIVQLYLILERLDGKFTLFHFYDDRGFYEYRFVDSVV